MSNQSDDENEESDNEELDNAIREVDQEENKLLSVYQHAPSVKALWQKSNFVRCDLKNNKIRITVKLYGCSNEC